LSYCGTRIEELTWHTAGGFGAFRTPTPPFPMAKAYRPAETNALLQPRDRCVILSTHHPAHGNRSKASLHVVTSTGDRASVLDSVKIKSKNWAPGRHCQTSQSAMAACALSPSLTTAARCHPHAGPSSRLPRAPLATARRPLLQSRSSVPRRVNSRRTSVTSMASEAGALYTRPLFGST
jgi:hypothetical protein